MNRTFLKLFLTFLLSLSSQVQAGNSFGPSPDNAQLRLDLQVLNDYGIIDLPVTTWPIPWQAIEKALKQAQASDPKLLGVLERVNEQLPSGIEASLVAQAGLQPALFTHFGTQSREEESLAAQIGWTEPRWSGLLALTGVEDDIYLDGSYLALSARSWQVGVGLLDQWWGPGWQSSLILSHNARPVPALFLSRNTTEPFKSPWLSWLGAWHLVTFMGQMESDRVVPEAWLWGLRFNFRPSVHWDIGLSRTALWAGQGRPKNAKVFWDLLIGKDNYEIEDEGKVTEPSNQLGGLDVRYTHPLHKGAVALYGQIIGEDEAGGLPSRSMFMLGASVTTFWLNQPATIFIEYADTALDGFKSDTHFDSAYNHGIYQTGYRYRGRVMGSSFDNDTRSLTWGTVFNPRPGQSAQLLMTHLKLNRDGEAGNNTTSSTARTLTTASARYSLHIDNHHISVYGDYLEELPQNRLGVEKKPSIGIMYQFDFL